MLNKLAAAKGRLKVPKVGIQQVQRTAAYSAKPPKLWRTLVMR
jgi:hypothetical protein